MMIKRLTFFCSFLLLATNLCASNRCGRTSLLPSASQEKRRNQEFYDPTIYICKEGQQDKKGSGLANQGFYLAWQQFYTWLDQAKKSDLQGHVVSVRGGGYWQWRQSGCIDLFLNVFGEGYWNGGPICDDHCSRANIQEYQLGFHLGLPFYNHSNVLLIPYIGIGYDSYRNNKDPDSANFALRYSKWNLPLGLILKWCLGQCWSFTPDLQVRPDLSSNVKVKDKTKGIKNKCGFRVTLPFNYERSVKLPCCKQHISTLFLTFAPVFDWESFGAATKKHHSCLRPIPSHNFQRSLLGYRLQATLNF